MIKKMWIDDNGTVREMTKEEIEKYMNDENTERSN